MIDIPIVTVKIERVDISDPYPVGLRCEWESGFSGDTLPINLSQGDDIKISIPAFMAWFKAKERIANATAIEVEEEVRRLI